MPSMPIQPTSSVVHSEPAPRQEARVQPAVAAATRHVDTTAAMQAAQAATQAHDLKGSSKGSPRGHVYALKDGSGFAVLGSDGNYYRLDTSSSLGMFFSQAMGYVEKALVNVSGGPVSHFGSQPLDLPGSTSEAEAPPPPLPLIKDSGEAQAAADTAQTMIRQSPVSALRSQANLDPMNVMLLLR